MDASYSIFTKFRLKSLVVLFTQSAILIYLGCYALYQLRIDPLSALAKKYLRFIGWLSIGFGVAILLEDTFVIFNIDQYSDIVFKINNRNVSEDIYTIILSIAIIYFCNRDFPLSVLEKTLLNWKKINQMNPYFWRLFVMPIN